MYTSESIFGALIGMYAPSIAPSTPGMYERFWNFILIISISARWGHLIICGAISEDLSLNGLVDYNYLFEEQSNVAIPQKHLKSSSIFTIVL